MDLEPKTLGNFTNFIFSPHFVPKLLRLWYKKYLHFTFCCQMMSNKLFFRHFWSFPQLIPIFRATLLQVAIFLAIFRAGTLAAQLLIKNVYSLNNYLLIFASLPLWLINKMENISYQICRASIIKGYQKFLEILA